MIPNPWVIIGILVTWLVSLVSVGAWQNSAGHTAEGVIWQKREIAQQQAYDAKYKELEARYRKLEEDGAQALADASAEYERRLQNVQVKNDELVAQLRDGTLRLRDKYASPGKTCGSDVSKTPTGPSQRNDAQAGQLSAETSRFLLGLTSDANKTAEQLAACQQVIVKDREIINGKIVSPPQQ